MCSITMLEFHWAHLRLSRNDARTILDGNRVTLNNSHVNVGAPVLRDYFVVRTAPSLLFAGLDSFARPAAVDAVTSVYIFFVPAATASPH